MSDTSQEFSFLDYPNTAVNIEQPDAYSVGPFEGDPDSWLNRFNVSLNNAQKSIFDSLVVAGKKVDSPELIKWAEDQAGEQELDISLLGQPTRTSSVTKGFDEIGEAYEKEGLTAAVERTGTLLQDMSADATGSLAMSMAAFVPAAATAAIGAPVAITGALALALPLAVGTGMSVAPIYEEAKKLGADEDTAQNASLAGGFVSGMLDKIGAGFLVNGLIKSFGKNAVEAELAQTVGKSMARKAVSAALATTKAVAVGGTKGMLTEGITEGAQEAVQIATARTAAGLPVISDNPIEQAHRLIDGAALGAVGGKAAGSVIGPIETLMGNKLAVRIKEQEDNIDSLKKGIVDAENDIAKTEKLDYVGQGETNPMEGSQIVSSTVKAAISPLANLANNHEGGSKGINALMSFPDVVSQTVGDLAAQVAPIFTKLKRSIKIPVLQKNISSKIDKRVMRSIITEQTDPDPRIAEAVEGLKNFYGQQVIDEATGEVSTTGIHAMAKEAGIDLKFEKGYIPVSYKTGKKHRKLMAKVLKENGFSTVRATELIENIDDNEGFFNETSTELNLNAPASTKATSSEIAREQKRTLDRKTRLALFDAGLVEDNVQGVTLKYILDMTKRIQLKKLADSLETNLNPLLKEGIMTPAEKTRVKNVFDALSSKYKPLNDRTFQAIQKNVLSGQFILTLPLASMQALSEPLIMLSRVSPKHALMGGIKASVNLMNATARNIFPKIPQNKSEKAFKGLLQGLDGVLSERFGDISNVSTNKKVTNAFFKYIGLTLVTQISRDMGFQAARGQLKEDLKTVYKIDGVTDQADKPKKTKGYYNARKRLTSMGIVNPMATKVQSWALGNEEVDPPMIKKAMSKTVDEIIMAPNAINKPLWMSDPHLALAAQLKGFMFSFGTNVGGRMYRDVAIPLLRGRVPAGDIAKYAATLTALVGAALFIQSMKEAIKYPEGEEPSKDMDIRERVIQALLGTNIFGGGTVLYSALNSSKYGSDFWASLLGPTASTVSGLATTGYDYFLGEDGERGLARELANLVPILRTIPMARDFKDGIVSNTESYLEDVKDFWD